MPPIPSPSRDNSNNYRQIFLSDTPLLDVRAPIEFSKGAFPCSLNIPLLDDHQREAIGIRYKEQGQDAAVELGWQLATPAIKQQRLNEWQKYIQQHPEGYLYCFRGGLRSRLSQQLIRDAGIDYPLITGGYKNMRRFLIDELDANSLSMPLVLIGGRTGSGKTILLQQLGNSIDLEGLANHRGSAFGRQLQPQPTQIAFENALSVAVMKQRTQHRTLITEDEGKLIGNITLPPGFLTNMKKSPLVILETRIEQRINLSLFDYVTSAWPQYQQRFGESDGNKNFSEQIMGNLLRIRKRLGGELHKKVSDIFSRALQQLYSNGNADEFRDGIEILLTQYYDPMYDYQQNLRTDQVIFRGSHDEILEWASHTFANNEVA